MGTHSRCSQVKTVWYIIYLPLQHLQNQNGDKVSIFPVTGFILCPPPLIHHHFHNAIVATVHAVWHPAAGVQSSGGRDYGCTSAPAEWNTFRESLTRYRARHQSEQADAEIPKSNSKFCSSSIKISENLQIFTWHLRI